MIFTRRCSIGFFCRAILIGELRGAFEDARLHDLAGFEFHDRARRDDHCLGGLLGIAAHALLGEAGGEDAEFAELDALAVSECFGDAVEGELDNGENLLLGKGCFVSDCDNEVALGEICHGAGGSGFKLQRQGE